MLSFVCRDCGGTEGRHKDHCRPKAGYEIVGSESGFSEDLQASCALVNLRVKLGMEPGAKVKDIVEKAQKRIEELELDLQMCRLYLEASRERLVNSVMGTVG